MEKKKVTKKTGRGGVRVPGKGKRLGRPRKFDGVLPDAGPVETRAINLPASAWEMMDKRRGALDESTYILGLLLKADLAWVSVGGKKEA